MGFGVGLGAAGAWGVEARNAELHVRGRGAARRVAAKRARVHKGRRGLLVSEVADKG